MEDKNICSMFSLQTWLLPSAPFLLHYISCLFSGLRKHFNTWQNGHWTEKDIVERAQKAQCHRSSRKPLAKRCLLPNHHRNTSSTPVPRFLQCLLSQGLSVALKALRSLKFVMPFPFLPSHYSYDKAEKPGKKNLSHLSSLMSVFASKEHLCFINPLQIP